MGVVYHGFDPTIGRDVAVKTMRLSEAGTGMSREELIGRFQTEARAAGLLTHPNIVVIFDAGEEDGLFYITMEYVQGRSLQSLIDSHQPFPVPRVLRLMEQVCSALDFAHQHNVVHRDIKPANLMLTGDDIVKITDFGTAKILQFGTAQTAHVMGTPSYMSPEQVKGKPVDGRSDIFSLGVILYELLTGEKPFPGQNITTVIYKIINEEPIPARSLDSSIHPGLSAVITRALAKEPAARYQNCHELLNALKSYHELANPEGTLRTGSTGLQNSTGASRLAAAAPRIPGVPAGSVSDEPIPSDHLMLPVLLEEVAPQKQPGGLLLTLILLAVIGFAGYRVYPPILDLWHRAHEPVEAPAVPAKAGSASAAPNSDSAGNPGAQASGTTQTAAPAPIATAAPAGNSALRDAPQPVAAPVKASRPAPAAGSSSEKSSAPQKSAPPAAPSPARLLESKLRAELAGQPFEDKVKIQATANALTLSGSLTLAEHRELLTYLGTIPAGVRIVDDVEFAEAPKETPAPSSAGWIWVRSSPPDARILVDGTETGLRTPARLELQPGEHDIRVVRRGFGTNHKNVQVSSGQTAEVNEILKIN